MPDSFSNGNVALTSGDTLEGDIVTYTCNGAYQFSGGADELMVTCQDNGLWEDVVQQCVIPDAGYVLLLY